MRKDVRNEWHCRLSAKDLRKLLSTQASFAGNDSFHETGSSIRLRKTGAMKALTANDVTPFISSGSAIHVRNLCCFNRKKAPDTFYDARVLAALVIDDWRIASAARKSYHGDAFSISGAAVLVARRTAALVIGADE